MKNKFVCDKSLTFQECELAILRNAVDLAENKMGKQLVNTPDVQQMIKIVEDFINRKISYVMEESQLMHFYRRSIRYMIKMSS
jgi:hypothetical protein